MRHFLSSMQPAVIACLPQKPFNLRRKLNIVSISSETQVSNVMGNIETIRSQTSISTLELMNEPSPSPYTLLRNAIRPATNWPGGCRMAKNRGRGSAVTLFVFKSSSSHYIARNPGTCTCKRASI